MRICLIIASVVLFAPCAPLVNAEVKFKKIKVDDLFRSEGVAIGDVNKDGKNDLCVGDLWYEAPDWKIHEIRKPRAPKRGGYTEQFGVYSGDFNKDGIGICFQALVGKNDHTHYQQLVSQFAKPKLPDDPATKPGINGCQ